MDETCPNCRVPVAPDARACPSCGLPRNLPAFDRDGTYLGTTFSQVGEGGRPQPLAPLAGSAPAPTAPSPPRLSRAITAAVVGVFVLAVALGVGVAVLLRPGGDGPRGNPPPPTPGPVRTLPPDPPETPDSATTGPYADVSRRVGSGAHRIVATTCTGTGIGTAYQFGTEGLLVTSARAVSGARAITVLSGDRIVTATVAKIDTTAGLAILKPAAPLTGHTLVLGRRQLAAGDQVAAIGWTASAQQPARGRARTSVGSITDVGVRIESPDGTHTVRRMTGEFDPGLAGAPVVDTDGHLVGMLVQGQADQKDLLVAGLDTIADPLLGPTGMPPAMEPCARSSGPAVVTTVGGPASASARTELGQWFGALNSGEWERARGVLAPRVQSDWPVEKLTADYAGTYAFNLVAAPDAGGVAVSWVRLGREGVPCQREAARFTLDQGKITGITPQGVAPC